MPDPHTSVDADPVGNPGNIPHATGARRVSTSTVLMSMLRTQLETTSHIERNLGILTASMKEIVKTSEKHAIEMRALQDENRTLRKECEVERETATEQSTAIQALVEDVARLRRDVERANQIAPTYNVNIANNAHPGALQRENGIPRWFWPMTPEVIRLIRNIFVAHKLIFVFFCFVMVASFVMGRIALMKP